MSTPPTHIAPDDLAHLNRLRSEAAAALGPLRGAKAVADAAVATFEALKAAAVSLEQAADVQTLKAAVKYRFAEGDTIDWATGAITRAPVADEPAEAAPEPLA